MYAGIRLNCRVFVNALCSTQQEMAVRVLPLYNKKSSAKALNLGGTTEHNSLVPCVWDEAVFIG